MYKIKYYSSLKIKEILPLGTMWTDLEHIMLSEVSQSQKTTNDTIYIKYSKLANLWR